MPMTPSGFLPSMSNALAALPQELRAHSQRVRDIAVALALRHGIAPEKADLAAAMHDLARAEEPGAVLAQAQQAGLPMNQVEQALPVLLHGPLAAYWLRQQHGVEDQDILDAVRWHTTAHPGFGPLAKVVFLADKLDPEKIARYPFQEQVKSLAENDLDAALLSFLDQELQALLEEGRLVHPASVEARNDLLMRRRPAMTDPRA